MKRLKIYHYIISFITVYLFFIFYHNFAVKKNFLEAYNLLSFFLPAFVLIEIDGQDKKIKSLLNGLILLFIILLFFPFKKINFSVLVLNIILFLNFYFYKFVFNFNLINIEISEDEIKNKIEALEIIKNEKLANYKKENEEKEKEIKEITSLYSAVKELNNVIKLDDTMETIVEIMKKILKVNFKISPDDVAYILLIRKEFDFKIAKIKGFEETVIKENERNIIQAILKNISHNKKIIYKPSILGERGVEIFGFIKSLLFIPLYAEKKLFGVLFLAGNKENIFTEKQIEYFEILANQIAISLEKAYLYEEVEQMSITDSLTGLYVHRYFQDKLENELKRASRYGTELSLIIGDIDFFKKINDTYGHLAGDYILKTISVILKNNTTMVDAVARYGGEEFVIILPDTGKDKAHLLAVKIRKEIENYNFKFQEHQIKVTISMGVASYPSDAITRRALIEKADKALYKAKQEGRNRVVKS